MQRTYISFHTRFIFWTSITATACLLVLYMFFMYLSVHMSYALDHAEDRIVAQEQTFQKEQQRYITALESFHISEELASDGFSKITSPVFLSRTSSVAFQGQ